MRYNIFNQIHKGLRTLLFDTANMIQRTDFSNSDDTKEIIKRIKEVVHQFENHADHEDGLVFPALSVAAPLLVKRLEEEHEMDKKIGNAISHFLDELEFVQDADLRVSHGVSMMRAFNEFVGFNLYHMNVEEREINEVLWINYSDQEIVKIQSTILAKINPEDNAYMAKWMILGMNDPELKTWFATIKATAPAFVYEQLLNIAILQLSEERFNKIVEEHHSIMMAV